jgi:hypothetical protein
MGEIEFKGELHTIPAGAALVLKVDRMLSAEQTNRIREHCAKVFGAAHPVLVVGPEFEVTAVTPVQFTQSVDVGGLATKEDVRRALTRFATYERR